VDVSDVEKDARQYGISCGPNMMGLGHGCHCQTPWAQKGKSLVPVFYEHLKSKQAQIDQTHRRHPT